jgi:glycosyltransferase involved in cell wall biosynthesis
MVVQRCGLEVNGGAELACLEVAREMSKVWDVTIVTTCARDYSTWENFYEAGAVEIDGVRVLRFKVDGPRSPFFDNLCRDALARGSSFTTQEHEAWMRAQGPYSTGLLRYVEANRDEFDLWIFYTYLYATTYFALPLVRERALLVPFAHDEWPIHLPAFDAFFKLPRRLIFSTEEERDFLFKRFGDHLDGPVIGVGIHAPDDVQGARFRQRIGIDRPYALYVGRIEKAKQCDVLVHCFDRYHELYDDDFQLIMLGRAVMELPSRPWLRPLGFVEESTKYDAIAGSDVLVAPSSLESLSLVLLEAWSQERPVLVNGDSDVMVGQCRGLEGGGWYHDADE